MTTDLTRLLTEHLIDVTNPFGDKGTEEATAKRMHAALVAVVGVLDQHANEAIAQYKANGPGYYDGYSDGSQVAELRALDAITTALTKGDGRG